VGPNRRDRWSSSSGVSLGSALLGLNAADALCEKSCVGEVLPYPSAVLKIVVVAVTLSEPADPGLRNGPFSMTLLQACLILIRSTQICTSK